MIWRISNTRVKRSPLLPVFNAVTGLYGGHFRYFRTHFNQIYISPIFNPHIGWVVFRRLRGYKFYPLSKISTISIFSRVIELFAYCFLFKNLVNPFNSFLIHSEWNKVSCSKHSQSVRSIISQFPLPLPPFPQGGDIGGFPISLYFFAFWIHFTPYKILHPLKYFEWISPCLFTPVSIGRISTVHRKVISVIFIGGNF